MFKYSGYILIGIALLHQMVGIIFYAEPLSAIAQAGILNTVMPPYWDRDAAFWFLMFGFMLLLFGAITQWLLQEVKTLPAFWGWGLLAICGIGVAVLPASGFWLVIPVALVMIRHASPATLKSPA